MSLSPDVRPRLNVLFAVADRPDSSAIETVAALLDQHRWVMGNNTSEHSMIRAGDRICIYIGRRGVVADAVVAAAPQRAPVSANRDLSRYPWAVELRQVRRYLDRPVVVDRALRSGLDAFSHRDLDRPWGWFVKRPQLLSDRDFEILTASAGEDAGPERPRLRR